MATFEAQVEGLTGLDVDTSPTTGELTEFLKDGVIDVTQKCILMNPQNAEQFTRISGEVESNGSEKVARADILSVVREADVNDDWRECRRIPTSLQSRVTDTTSLHFASSYNPVYMVAEDGAISVFPTPGATTKAFKVYYINNDPRGDDDNSVTHNTTGLAFFPKNKVYLVIIYAAIRTIDVNLSFPTIPDLSLVWPFPSVPSAPTVSDPGVSTLTDVPIYIIPELSTSITDMDTQITNEDPEMAGVIKDKVMQQIAEYESNIKNNLNAFNRDKTIYEANLKKILKAADVSAKFNTDKLQKYKAEIDSYTSNVGQVVQENQGRIAEYQQKVSSLIQEFNANAGWLQTRKQDLIREYNSAFNIMAPAQEQPQQEARG